MIVDNLLGRSAPPPDNSPADLASFREALLLGWQRLEAAIERNIDNEQLTVVHLHWASTAAVCACKSPILILSTLTLTTVVHGCPVCMPSSELRMVPLTSTHLIAVAEDSRKVGPILPNARTPRAW